MRFKWPLTKFYTVLLGLVLATVALAASVERIPKDILELGSGTSSDKVIKFNNGAANPATIKLNNTTGTLQFANDGQNFLDFGSGAASGINFIENSNAETSATDGLTLSGVASSAHTGAQLINGKQSFLLTPSGTFTADWALTSIPARWNGNNFGIDAYVDVPALDSGVTLTVGLHDGTDFVESYEITQAGNYPVQLIAPYDSGETYTFRIASTAGTPTASGLVYVDDVYVGPSVPVIGQSFAEKISLSYFPSVLITIPSGNTATQVNMDTARWDNSNAVSNPSTDWTFTAPRAGSYLVNFQFMTNTSTQANGSCYLNTNLGGEQKYEVMKYFGHDLSSFESVDSGKVLQMQAGDTFKLGCQTNGGMTLRGVVSSGISNQLGTRIDVTEITNHPVTTYAVNPQIEYAYNNSGITTAGTTEDTSFAYGPEGAAIGAINSTTSNAATVFGIKFRTPVRDSDVVTLQIKAANQQWIDAGSLVSVESYNTQGSSTYGIGLREASSGNADYWVYFGNKGRENSNTSYAANGATWAGTASWRWRVRKVSAGAAAIPVADALTYGTTKINQIIERVDDSYRTSTANNLLALNNVPGGWYRLSVGADYFYQVSGSTSAAIIDPVLNGNTIPIAGDTIRVGYTDASSVDSQIYNNGLTTSRLVFFPNATNTFWINVTIQVAGSAVNDAFYTLERLQNVEVITNQWD